MSCAGEERVEVDRAVGRRLLEERIGVVPRAQLGDRAAEPRCEPLVEPRLPAREGLGGRAIGLGERLDELPLVELVGREREREPVAVPEPARRLVPQSGELADVVGDLGADGLRRLPRLLPLGGIFAWRRMRLISVSPTSAPPTTPRWREKRMSTEDSSSTIRARELVGDLVREHEL